MINSAEVALNQEPKNSDPEKFIAEYHEKSLLYQNFCSTMQNLLINLLDNNGFKYQISMRLKSADSIREKMIRNKSRGKIYYRLSDMTDLAGVRIVFYLESDKRWFIDLLFREFSPDKMKMEEHHKETGYRSIHIVVQFGRKRLALNEYRHFAGLNCEIQLTSALYQAWSEVEHDIFYKQDLYLKAEDWEAMHILRKEMETALKSHIEQASEILESVAEKIEQLRIQNRGIQKLGDPDLDRPNPPEQ